jgi:hypothetical protein
MFTLICYTCPCKCDLPDESNAVQQAHQHARTFGHNVGVYESKSLAEGAKRELLAIVLKWQPKAA